MAKFDLEMFYDDVRATLVANLPAKIAEINAEKNDAIALALIPEEAYFFQQLEHNRLANHTVNLLYGEDDVNSTSQGPGTVSTVSVSVVVIVADSGQEANLAARMLRYRRCLLEIFQKNWNQGRGGVKLEVKSLVPIPLTNLTDGSNHRAIGVQLEGTIS